MVSKVAVIALVAIVACPILLGYGMNLSEVTETKYENNGVQATNVNGLLENGHTVPSFNYTHSDILQTNSKFYAYDELNKIPLFESISNNRSSLQINKSTITNTTYNNTSVNVPDSTYRTFYIEFDSSAVGATIYYTQGGGVEESAGYFGGVRAIYVEHYGADGNRYTVWYNIGGGYTGSVSQGWNVTRLVLSGGPVNGYTEYYYQDGSGMTNKYADIAAGYYFSQTTASSGDHWPSIGLPTYTKQYTISLNLDSITDSNYTFRLNLTPFGVMYENGGGAPRYAAMELKKTTTNGIVSWTLRNETDSSAEITQLYFDPSVQNNTYQFTFVADQLYESGYYYPLIHITASYIGSWPTLIGIAQSYKTYNLDYVLRDNPALITSAPLSQEDLSFYRVIFKAYNGVRSPTMRIDDALIRAFKYYSTITDRVYDPGSVRENPSTKISDIQIYGSSIAFGGYTYAVNSDGNITLGNHSVSLNNMLFESVPNGAGTYDNLINGIVVSTTLQPSTITFNGTWAAKVSTSSLEVVSYTSTQWTPGEFAWDGLDQNFLMIGLLAALGVFIALGIAYRKVKSALFALLVVCGGAAVLFFTML